MYHFQPKKLFLLLMLNSLFGLASCFALSDEARSKGFVYLHEVDPTILVSPRYASSENFIGKPIDGYKKPVIIITRQAAEALKRVQDDLRKDGYCLVIYDAYRPQQAVDHFAHWSEDVKDQQKKACYYPRIDKADAFHLGYISKRSGHSRGSTVDLTIIKDGEELHAIEEKDRTLSDGCVIKILDDGTVDMGSSFDLLDEASHTASKLVGEEFGKLRMYLKAVMEKHGFKNYDQEWWHFNMNNELHRADQDSSYFNFPVE